MNKEQDLVGNSAKISLEIINSIRGFLAGKRTTIPEEDQDVFFQAIQSAASVVAKSITKKGYFWIEDLGGEK